jgi:small GTP-binding protein
MKILKPVQSALQKLQWWKKPASTNPDQHLLDADSHIQALLSDTNIPAVVKQELSREFAEIEVISDKIKNGEIHIAAFGRVGTGKSSLLNALLGKNVFSTSTLHGETKSSQHSLWDSVKSEHVVLIDTPGIDELEGEDREALAHSVTRVSDIVLLVCEGDLTSTEFEAVRELAEFKRPLLLVLNKSDRYSQRETESLISHLRARCEGLVSPENIIPASADPRPETVIQIDDRGREQSGQRSRSPDISVLQRRLWNILATEGKELAALNAALFTNELDIRVAEKIVAARKSVAEKVIRRKSVAEKVIRNYCLAKGMAVAVNPIPVADLLAAAGTDITMVVHLGRIYGFTLSRREAGNLLLTISAQLLALMGAYWGVNMVSAGLKTISAGMTTALTAGAQGTLAWYATYVTGKAAQTWFAKGKSWGSAGPKETIGEILDNLDRDSILRSARSELLRKIDKKNPLPP